MPPPLRDPVRGLFAKVQPRSVPLAWRNLLANKQRLLRSAAGIGFAVLLMLMQLGFEQAFFDSMLQVIRGLDGDILIQSVHKYQFATREPFPMADLETARKVTGVASRVEGEALVLEVTGSKDRELEEWTVSAKAGLLKEAFGLDVRLAEGGKKAASTPSPPAVRPAT